MSDLTVIMPVYNEELFLEEAIESILNQTFSDFKLVIINDNSTDGTEKIIKRFKERDPRIEYRKNKTNLGPAKSRNLAIDDANTEFIAFMDADDKAVSTRFEIQLKFLKSHPEIGVCGSWSTFFGEKNKVLSNNITHDEIKVGFLSHCAVHNPTVMLRRSCLGNLRYDENMVVTEDYSLFSQLISTTKFHNIPESLMFYRWHANNISKTLKDRRASFEFKIRTKQLENLGIDPKDPKIDNYVSAIVLNRKQSTEAIRNTVKCAHLLKTVNKERKYFDQKLFTEHVDTIIIRTIRNAKSYDRAFYRFLKNESGYFSKIPKLDLTILFFKSYFK